MRAIARDNTVDLEAAEQSIRSAVLRDSAHLLRTVFERANTMVRAMKHDCPQCGQRMVGGGRKERTVTTLLGEVRYSRALYRCACGAMAYPADALLDIEGASRSPGLRRVIARLGAQESFAEASADLLELAAVNVSAKDCERYAEATGKQVRRWQESARPQTSEPFAPDSILYIEMDGTGVPMVRRETEGRTGKGEDKIAKTREAKVGCVFTQTALDDKGRPVRDLNSTTFVGAIETAEEFGHRLFAEAQRRGLERAFRVVVLSDGAEWIANLIAEHFPNAIHILDLYHALEHLTALCTLVYGKTLPAIQQRERLAALLREGEITEVFETLRPDMPDYEEGKEAWNHFYYLGKRAHLMRYAEFRAQGFFVGSGVIEAGCKNVIAKRLKQSGMHWTLEGANNIIALRCILSNKEFEDFWAEKGNINAA